MLTTAIWTIIILFPLIILKWLRWHFISRRFVSIPAKQSFMLYLAFLPSTIHPFLYPIELGKAYFFKKIPQIWLWEKLNELLSLYFIFNLHNTQATIISLAAIIILNLTAFKLNKAKANFNLNIYLGTALLIAQSILISLLTSLLINDIVIATTISAIISLIIVTTKYSYFKNNFFKKDQTHFNEIADLYEDDIKAPMRNKLLQKKIEIMRQYISPQNNHKGLDIGCGQGWYAIEMAKEKFSISAIDPSEGQIKKAKTNLIEKSLNIDFKIHGAQSLPYPDNTFDFAYSINVFHHIIDLEDRKKAFDEVIRVLKPGGIFFLHEINIKNPLFRFYMCYIFALIRNIDEGNERFILPNKLPKIENAQWQQKIDYFTFLPDFIPQRLLNFFAPLEAWLEKSKIKSWSAHYTALLVKTNHEKN